MKKKVFAAALAAGLCLSLAVPALAADTPTYAKALPADAVQQEEGTAVGGFTDVQKGDYCADAVLWAVEQEVTSGTGPSTFSPERTCTTAEILTFLWRASGSPEINGSTPFADVDAGDYYAQAAAWAYDEGLVSGRIFGGDTPCTRAATVTYLWKLAGQPYAPGADFSDVPGSADYAQAVAWAVKENITSGTGNGAFSPDVICTRGQIVTFLYRYFAA